MKKAKVNRLVIATFSGALSGAIIGLLFAPEKGSTIRNNISKSGDKYIKKLKDEVKHLRKQINKQAKTAQEGLQELGENAKNKGKALYNNTKKLSLYEEWTKDELYEYAKEKGIDGYTKMNKEELIKVLKDQ